MLAVRQHHADKLDAPARTAVGALGRAADYMRQSDNVQTRRLGHQVRMDAQALDEAVAGIGQSGQVPPDLQEKVNRAIVHARGIGEQLSGPEQTAGRLANQALTELNRQIRSMATDVTAPLAERHSVHDDSPDR